MDTNRSRVVAVICGCLATVTWIGYSSSAGEEAHKQHHEGGMQCPMMATTSDLELYADSPALLLGAPVNSEQLRSRRT